jgi:hypothetical protein
VNLWPWSWPSHRRRHIIGRIIPVVCPSPPPGAPTDHLAALDEARAARASSERAIVDARERTDALHEVTEALRGTRARDRFAEQMDDTFRSHRRREEGGEG